jgi:hypothetical protein
MYIYIYIFIYEYNWYNILIVKAKVFTEHLYNLVDHNVVCVILL